MGVIKGDTRSSDYGSYRVAKAQGSTFKFGAKEE